MTVRPIAFTGPMVKALLDGRKTQTRRVLKTQPSGQWDAMFCNDGDWYTGDALTGARIQKLKVPYAIGDLLYVRECWRTPESLDHLSPRQIAERCDELGYRGYWCPRVTEADGLTHQWSEEDGFRDDEPTGRLRAAMHMPRWATRLTLKVTDVRVERVQEISLSDAMNEGVSGVVNADGDARRRFCRLWDSINEARGFGWEVNPWVVAISFTVIRQNVDEYFNAMKAQNAA